MELEYCFDRLLYPIICRKRCENLQKNPLWGACEEQKKLLRIQNLTKNGTCPSMKMLLYLNRVESLHLMSSICIDECCDCSHPSLCQTFAVATQKFGDSGIPPKSVEAILLTETVWYESEMELGTLDNLDGQVALVKIFWNTCGLQSHKCSTRWW